MSKPVAIIDPSWRRVEELFSNGALSALEDHCELVWVQNDKMPNAQFDAALSDAAFVIQAIPEFNRETLDRATNLRAIFEVSGSFPGTIDYQHCRNKNIEVLCCAPGFRRCVAEMALTMVLASARGLIDEHEAFREGKENWLDDVPERDFSLFGATIGFIGFGQIARETARLMGPFAPEFLVYDPWLPEDSAHQYGVRLTDLKDLISQSDAVIVAAAPTAENRGMISEKELSWLRRNALLVLISRAHLVDYQALRDAVLSGRIRAALDVFPQEPMPADDPMRHANGVILSPHRAAAVDKGRQLIGDMIVSDIVRMLNGGTPDQLQRAQNVPIEKLQGVGDADKVGNLMVRYSR